MKQSISSLAVVCACTLGVLSLSSCATDPYAYDPEGTSYSTLPVGYTAMMLGGLSYYYYNDHYCRYWPGRGYVVVRPPHGRPPYHRPPTRPPGTNPGRPDKPAPGYPGYKPGNPGVTPPATRPSNPSIQPVTKPVTNPNWRSGSPSYSRGGYSGGGARGGGMRGGGGRSGGRR